MGVGVPVMGPGLGKRAVLCCFGLLSLAQQAVRASPCRPQPLATPLPQREVLVYWSSRLPVDPASWQGLDWARMTTVAVFHPWPPPADMICRAHSAGVRVVNSDGTQWMHTALRSNATHRAAWVESHASQMMASGTDGVNVDLEAYRGGLPGSTAPTPNAAAHLFTELLASLRAGLRRRNPHAQLSIASSVLPTSYPAYFYGGYNMTAIAAEIDFFVVMAYDMNDALRLARRGTASSVPPGHWDEHANAPLPGIIDGVAEYAGLKVGPAQLVLALPWYGYLFTCTNNSRGAYCDIQGDQVHGCPRSACPQISFGQIQALRTNHSAAGPILRDDDSASVFFEWLNSSGVRHQVWFDDATTLGRKMAWARQAGLRGVGVFLSSMLGCSGGEACAIANRDPAVNTSRRAMWSALDRFRGSGGAVGRVRRGWKSDDLAAGSHLRLFGFWGDRPAADDPNSTAPFTNLHLPYLRYWYFLDLRAVRLANPKGITISGL